MGESDTLQRMVLVQRSHELLCPDCEACITHDVILRKRKREFQGPSTSKVAGADLDSEEEEEEDSDSEDDPDDTIPQVLLEQETHDIFCPVCEYSITHEVILQKRKRNSVEPSEEIGRLPEISEDLGNRRESSPTGFARDLFEDVTEADIDEIYMRSVLHQQTTFDLLCPDCEACITHQLIFQKRKRAVSRSTSDSAAESSPRQRQPETTTIDHDEREELPVKGSRQEDPPLKRQRKSLYAGGPGADEEEDELRRILSGQTTNDIACPDCKSLITHEVILRRKVRRLKSKAIESEGTVLYQDNRDRLPFDKNPWKTRYKRFYRRLRGIAAAADEREDPRPRAANYGTVTNRSLTEPLLPEQKARTAFGRYQGMRESFSDTWRNSLIYFATLLFLWCVWLILHYL